MVIFFLSGINLFIFFPLNRKIYRIVNARNILCKEQDESHPDFIFSCKMSKITLDYILEPIYLI